MMKTLFTLVMAWLLPVSAVAQERVLYTHDEKGGFTWTEMIDEQGKRGAVGKKGKVLLPTCFDFIFYLHSNGGFTTQLDANNSEGFYTQTGKCVIPHARGYNDIRLYNSDGFGYYFEVTKGRFEGICDGKGNEIIPPDRYTDVMIHSYGKRPYFTVEINGRQGICDASGREVLPPRYSPYLYVTDEGKIIHTADGKRTEVQPEQPFGTENPFKENKVKSKRFYVDFGGEDAPNSLLPLPEAPEKPLVAEVTPVDKPLEGSERVGDVYSEEEIAAINGLIQAADLKVGETITVQIPATEEEDADPYPLVSEEAKEEARRQIRRESLEEARESMQRKDYIDAYNRSISLLKDDQFYPKDPDEQCEFVTFLDEVKKGITSDMLTASISVNVNQYLLLSTVYMDIEGWQKKLLVSAIGQGSQKAVFMLQVMNAANGGGAIATPNAPIDFNQDYEPSLIQVEETCTLCKGSGKICTQSVTTYSVRSQYVDETCPSCGGTGKTKHLRNNPRKGR